VPTVAYLANQFPSPVEPYVFEEIEELRRRGVQVIACSARRPGRAEQEPRLKALAAETLYLQPLGFGLLFRAFWLCLFNCALLAGFLARVLLQGNEPPARRLRLLHTLLGAYLDTKLKHCSFCVTVSEFNRRFILEHYPEVEAAKIVVQRMGVDSSPVEVALSRAEREPECLTMLAVGRLHPVKDHAFLLRACHELKKRRADSSCLIAGEGAERPWLEHLIRNLGLEAHVKLLGHLSCQQLDARYAMCDLVVLTSRSEGIPLVLMEAMAHGKTVLAPAITGIPELVRDGQTGFLYRAGSLEDFTARIETIRGSRAALPRLRRAARQHVREHFDREKNLASLADLLVSRITQRVRHNSHENPVLQQI
jgi:glycosyltransferase involved in cell wall biosynthesis